MTSVALWYSIKPIDIIDSATMEGYLKMMTLTAIVYLLVRAGNVILYRYYLSVNFAGLEGLD